MVEWRISRTKCQRIKAISSIVRFEDGVDNWSMATDQERQPDIERVRRMLDDLLGQRDSCGWSDAESARYRELCMQERALLKEGRLAG